MKHTALILGEKESHGSFAAFQEAVRSAVVDTSELSSGVARYKAADGKHLGIHWNDDPLNLGVWHNGRRRDLAADARSLYRGPVINAPWGAGVLEVEAGGESFRCEVTDDGEVRFR